jgi:hypothetical protein
MNELLLVTTSSPNIMFVEPLLQGRTGVHSKVEWFIIHVEGNSTNAWLHSSIRNLWI